MPNPDQDLLKAAAAGDLAGVNRALQAGARIDAKTQYNDTALNEAALWGHIDVVKRLLEEKPDIENKGGAQLTPLMNAASRGHFEVVQLLLEKGAAVSNDLLSVIQTKINILEENAEGGMVTQEGVDAWKGFQDSLITERWRQDMPLMVRDLSGDGETQRRAAAGLAEASGRGVDVAAAAPGLIKLLSEAGGEMRNDLTTALVAYFASTRQWEKLPPLLQSGDEEQKRAAVVAMSNAAVRGHVDPSLLPLITGLLSDGDAEVRRHAEQTMTYAATHGVDVTGAVPELIKLLSDPDASLRRGTIISLYRLAKKNVDVSAAIPALEALLKDENEEITRFAEQLLAVIRVSS